MCMGKVWFPGEQLMGHALSLENGIIFGLNAWETSFLGSVVPWTTKPRERGTESLCRRRENSNPRRDGSRQGGRLRPLAHAQEK